jgi:uncharacterized membrane protein
MVQTSTVRKAAFRQGGGFGGGSSDAATVLGRI